jgi:type III restriction enzyme
VNKTAFPELFQNDPGRLWTIRIDSKRLEKVESEDPDATRDEAAKELREIVNTVGKPGKPGQDVRCVVSVSMLSEGWDANKPISWASGPSAASSSASRSWGGDCGA